MTTTQVLTNYKLVHDHSSILAPEQSDLRTDAIMNGRMQVRHGVTLAYKRMQLYLNQWTMDPDNNDA